MIGGDGHDTMRSGTQGGQWRILGDDAARLDGLIDFDGIETLGGGSGADQFTLDALLSFGGDILGGGGVDTIVAANVASEFRIEGTNSGVAAGIAFSGIENLRGGASNDRFIFSGNASLGGSADGAGGSDTVVGPDGRTNAWSLTGTGQGTLNGSAFADIDVLTGGDGTDGFTVAAGVAAFGAAIDGRSGNDTLRATDGTNAWTLSGARAGTWNSSTAFADIETLEGGSGADTLNGPNESTTWNLTGAGSGDVVDTLFSGMENLTGASGQQDEFVVANGGSLTGTLNGGGGPDTLLSKRSSNQWSIDGINAGILTGVGRFAGVENLRGEDGTDTFTFANNAARVEGRVDGGGGANTLDYSARTNAVEVDFSSSVATGTGGIDGITRLIGGASAADKMIGPDGDATWHLTGADAGDVEGITFSGIENISGADGDDDSFIVQANGSVSGLLRRRRRRQRCVGFRTGRTHGHRLRIL